MNGKQLSITDTIKEQGDGRGNYWYLDENSILLKLVNEKNPRKIGVLFDRRLITFRNREKHLMVVNESYGFNEEVLKSLDIDYVDIYEDNKMYRVPKSVVFEKGSYLHFKEEGYERQIFLPIRIIEQYVSLLPEDEKRINLLGEEWFYKLKEEFVKPYMIRMGRFLAERRKVTEVYPDGPDIFRALRLTPFSNVKVVIVGQDPYHTPKVADGLAFSSKLETYVPPSLDKIYEALEKEFFIGDFLEREPSLTHWAEQGVLLLNRTLTVEKGNPNIHRELGWKIFTDKIFNLLREHPNNLVFLLWGSSAKTIKPIVENGRHLILEAEHPAFAARDMRDWDNEKCFSKCNAFLKSVGQSVIEW